MGQSVKVQKLTTPSTILATKANYHAVGVRVANTGVVAGEGGRKVIKAGSPLKGDLTNRGDFTLAKEAEDQPLSVGVLLHDLDVTDGTENGSMLTSGVVNWDKVDNSLITADVKNALKQITFMSIK